MKETSILFTGDIGFDNYMTGKWADEALLDTALQSFFDTADHVAANVEGALYRPENGEQNCFFHAAPPEAAVFLDRIRADIWDLANNHTMDAGLPGLESTLALAAAHGAQAAGAGRTLQQSAAPVILPEAGGIGILCAGSGCLAGAEKPGVLFWKDYSALGEAIRTIRKSCRWCVVVGHGGEEFASMPLPYVRAHFLRLLELGADIVVGHHPHVPQNYELFPDGKAVFYSLGNLVFDTDYQRSQPCTDLGVLLKLSFTEQRFRFEAVGAKLCRQQERLYRAPLPAIFRHISAEDYRRLTPLHARVFLAAVRRRQEFLHPEQFSGDAEAAWQAFLDNPQIPGARKGGFMDIPLIRELAALPGNPEDCDPNVIAYLTRQL